MQSIATGFNFSNAYLGENITLNELDVEVLASGSSVDDTVVSKAFVYSNTESLLVEGFTMTDSSLSSSAANSNGDAFAYGIYFEATQIDGADFSNTTMTVSATSSEGTASAYGFYFADSVLTDASFQDVTLSVSENGMDVTETKGAVFNETLGDENGYVKYYQWELNENGNLELIESSSVSADLTVLATNNTRIEIVEGDTSYETNGISESFAGVYAYTNTETEILGGAISNASTIGDITGDFVANYVYNEINSSSYTYSYSGAIANSSTIGDITGDFIGNYAYGGAIYNYTSYSYLEEISLLALGDDVVFEGNYRLQ